MNNYLVYILNYFIFVLYLLFKIKNHGTKIKQNDTR